MKDHNKYYWNNKNDRARIAETHTVEMERRYGSEIESSVSSSIVYGVNCQNKTMQDIIHQNKGKSKQGPITYTVKSLDSVSAVFTESKGKTAVLNFASYKYPGGGFMAGSRAQEECLCHESFLYNVLNQHGDYYEWNNANLNKSLYLDRAIYSPDVVFIKDNREIKCDVITCASPNFSAASRHVDRSTNNKALRSRIRFILEIAKNNQVDTLILGAFGCGVFEQDPETVARYFHLMAEHVFANYGINIVFAVIPPLPHQQDNLSAFQSEFTNKSINT